MATLRGAVSVIRHTVRQRCSCCLTRAGGCPRLVLGRSGGALTKRSLLITSLEQVRDLALCILIEVATVTGVPLIRNR